MKLVYHIPVIGWILRAAAEGSAGIKAVFLLACVVLWLLAILIFGYPAIIVPALCLTAGMFVLLVLIMNG